MGQVPYLTLVVECSAHPSPCKQKDRTGKHYLPSYYASRSVKFTFWLDAKWLNLFHHRNVEQSIKFVWTLPVHQLRVALRRLESKTSVLLHPNVSEICCIFLVPLTGILVGEWRHVHTTTAYTYHWNEITRKSSCMTARGVPPTAWAVGGGTPSCPGGTPIQWRGTLPPTLPQRVAPQAGQLVTWLSPPSYELSNKLKTLPSLVLILETNISVISFSDRYLRDCFYIYVSGPLNLAFNVFTQVTQPLSRNVHRYPGYERNRISYYPSEFRTNFDNALVFVSNGWDSYTKS